MDQWTPSHLAPAPLPLPVLLRRRITSTTRRYRTEYSYRYIVNTITITVFYDMTWKTLYTFQTWIESEKLSEDSKLLAEKSIEKWTFLVLLLFPLQNIAASNTDYTSMQYYYIQQCFQYHSFWCWRDLWWWIKYFVFQCIIIILHSYVCVYEYVYSYRYCSKMNEQYMKIVYINILYIQLPKLLLFLVKFVN